MEEWRSDKTQSKGRDNGWIGHKGTVSTRQGMPWCLLGGGFRLLEAGSPAGSCSGSCCTFLLLLRRENQSCAVCWRLEAKRSSSPWHSKCCALVSPVQRESCRQTFPSGRGARELASFIRAAIAGKNKPHLFSDIAVHVFRALLWKCFGLG